MTNYPPRLIEVDLPIKRISAHARREKSIHQAYQGVAHLAEATKPEVHVIQDPIRVGWEPIVKVEHYHASAARVLLSTNDAKGE